jgi:hypothetical protein
VAENAMQGQGLTRGKAVAQTNHIHSYSHRHRHRHRHEHEAQPSTNKQVLSETNAINKQSRSKNNNKNNDHCRLRHKDTEEKSICIDLCFRITWVIYEPALAAIQATIEGNGREN